MKFNLWFFLDDIFLIFLMMANIIISSMTHVTQMCIICVTLTCASYFTVGAMSVRFLGVTFCVTLFFFG